MNTLIALAALLVPAAFPAPQQKQEPPSFSLAWSEWPGWSIYGVAEELGLLDGKKGALGTVEQQYGVDVVLQEMDYDPCLTAYGSGTVDAVCVTNMDILGLCLSRESVAILINDTSEGGDMWLTTDPLLTWESLKNRKEPLELHGLQNSVSHYVGVRLLERHGLGEDAVRWVNMDPGAAATAMQQGNLQNIVAWNPFCLNVLNANKKARVLGSSKEIPGEVMDLVVVDQKVLDQPGGKGFALALIDAYYRVMERLVDPKTQDDTVTAVGAKFSRLPLEEMRKVLDGTKYVTTPQAAIEFFTGPDCRVTMTKVADFCMAHLNLEKRPTVGYGTREKAGTMNFRFDPSYLQAFAQGR
ncbi:MAG: hypothetical protein HY520_01445 [Candidatus Aenigmarchaeota archaeon]|nr:hypothetical protein [Candidatus Aenigmarchaeota archaeon]